MEKTINSLTKNPGDEILIFLFALNGASRSQIFKKFQITESQFEKLIKIWLDNELIEPVNETKHHKRIYLLSSSGKKYVSSILQDSVSRSDNGKYRVFGYLLFFVIVTNFLLFGIIQSYRYEYIIIWGGFYILFVVGLSIADWFAKKKLSE